MDRLQTITLALLQGVTEFLPISSAAHLILASELTGWPDQGLAFDIAVHLGSLVAVLAYYRRDCAAFAVSAWGGLRHRRRDAQLDLLLKIAVATLPLALCGLALRDLVANELRNGWVIATATLTFAFALWWANGQRGERELLGWREALLIGLAQALAIVPGVSRSGITISAALLIGLSRPVAARFAFLLAIPAISGAALMAWMELPADARGVQLPNLGLGAAIAGLSAYACIRLFIALIERIGLMPYVYYRLALGATLFMLLSWSIH